jgi:hypothetical protein
MALTKSSRPRQIEEESDAGAPNLPIGPDHEDVTTNHESGDARSPNLSIVEPDREDEDGDNESYRMLKMIMKKMKEMMNKP